MERKPDPELLRILKLSDQLAETFELITGEKIIETENITHENQNPN